MEEPTMEDRWTVYIRERARERKIANPWLKEKGSDKESTPSDSDSTR